MKHYIKAFRGSAVFLVHYYYRVKRVNRKRYRRYSCMLRNVHIHAVRGRQYINHLGNNTCIGVG